MERVNSSEPLPRSLVLAIVCGVATATVGVALLVLLGANPLILLVLPSLGVIAVLPVLFRAADRKRQRNDAS